MLPIAVGYVCFIKYKKSGHLISFFFFAICSTSHRSCRFFFSLLFHLIRQLPPCTAGWKLTDWERITSGPVLCWVTDTMHTHLVWFRGDRGSSQCYHTVITGLNTVSGVWNGFWLWLLLETQEILKTFLDMQQVSVVFYTPWMFVSSSLILYMCTLLQPGREFSTALSNILPTRSCQRKQTAVKKKLFSVQK